jgi:hypothetical protein
MLSLLWVLTLGAQEQIRLTTPEVITANTVTIRMFMIRPTIATIDVELATDTGRILRHRWGPNAATLTMIRNLNKADLSTRSLQQRILDRLVLDGVIQGTVEGDPQ